jgi:hypothetical protein
MRVKVIRIGVLDVNSSDLIKSVSLEQKAQQELNEQSKFINSTSNNAGIEIKE